MAREKPTPEERRRDPTRMINQPSLTTSSGRIWLVIGGISAAGIVALMLALSQLNPGVAFPVAVTVALSYVAMVIVLGVAWNQKAKLITAASLYGFMLAVSLVAVLLIAGAEASAPV